VEAAVDAANGDLSKERLSELGLEEGGMLSLNTSSIGRSSIPISSPDFVEAMYLMVIPLVMIFPVLLSANMTSDSVVGEKENGTLGILMASPASRLDIVLGKLIPVLALANLQFLAWLFLLENNILGSVRVFNKVPLLILLNLGALCFIGISLLISIRARSTKESNLYLTLVIMVLVFPLFVGMPDIGIPPVILDSMTLVRTIGYVAASPDLPLRALASPFIVLGLMGMGIVTLCRRSVMNLEPPPSR
jgi:ABC-type Na+ efflux pump permease subunit